MNETTNDPNNERTDSPSLPISSSPSSPPPPGAAPPTTTASAPAPTPIPSSTPLFPRGPNETPRAYSAFIAFFELGHDRSLQALADQLGENLGTLKRWSSQHHWTDRLHSFNTGLIQLQAQDHVTRHRQHSGDWANRLHSFREQEWEAAQKLLAAAQCFLETFGEEEMREMTLGQVSRALKISSTMGRLALAGAEPPQSSEPALSPIQQQLMDSIRRVYGEAQSSPSLPPQPS
jgi:hypothetical protein